MSSNVFWKVPALAAIIAAGTVVLAGCGARVNAQSQAQAASVNSDTGPTHINVVPDLDANNFKVEHADRFPLATATQYA
ncbi:MAG: hypothetical protein JO336_08135, partial [Acidobacteriia bacterium]|nr:hypothetical protein [Terriglobia bacterium]